MSAQSLSEVVVDPAVRDAIDEIRDSMGQSPLTDADWDKSKILFIGLVTAMLQAPDVNMIGAIINQIAAFVPEVNRTDEFQALVDKFNE